MFIRLLQHLRRKGPTYGERATVEDITAAYRFFLRRPPDPEGFAHFRRLVAHGLTLDRLIASFTDSDEYKGRIARESEIATVDLGGYVVCVRASETDFGKEIVATKQYEPHVRGAICELLKAGQTFVDIGANVGTISLLAAKIVGAEGTVISVEPNPDNVQLLYAGIVQNRFTNTRVLPYGASNKREVFSLTGGTSNTYLVPAKQYQEVGFYAQSIVLDEELADLAAIDFVKMDIEGHEPLALQGFSSLIKKHNPTLLTEFDPRCLRDVQCIEPREYAEQLFAFYNRLHVITPFGDSDSFASPQDLMRHWQKRNEEIAGQKLLPDGMLHFDIIATNT